MSNQLRTLMKAHKNNIERQNKIKVRKHLNADALFSTMKTGFDTITDHRPGDIQHSLGDTLMAGFAMFSLKDPSLLSFDQRRFSEPHTTLWPFTAWEAYLLTPPCVTF